LQNLNQLKINTDKYKSTIKIIDPISVRGRVTRVVGLLIESLGPTVFLGEICYIFKKNTRQKEIITTAEVVGFKGNHVLLMPLGDMTYISPGCQVVGTGKPLSIKVDDKLLGRIISGLGETIDGKGVLPPDSEERHILAEPPDPLNRQRINSPISTGIKAIDAILTIGKGQRMGIFSGSGVGKSTLIGMIARNTNATVNVIGLIGERGREVKEFIEKDLREEGLKRSVLVVATSAEPPLIRQKAAFTATTIAEYFRDKGHDVMLMMDSVTRFARAQREIGLAIGEPPATRGYTPSCFSIMPKLLERTGTSVKGSITGLYTILVEADDMDEPVADTVRGILDGHIVLNRSLANLAHYPAIDVLESVSRVMVDIVDEKHLKASFKLKELVATYKQAEDLINIGAYQKGSNPKIDEAINYIEKINAFLKQGIYEKVDFNTTKEMLLNLFMEE